MSTLSTRANSQRSIVIQKAESEWASLIQRIVNPSGKRVADIGYGKGDHTHTWIARGATNVTRIDLSEIARSSNLVKQQSISVLVRKGCAIATGIPDRGVDIVFARDLMHRLRSYEACFREAYRILDWNGVYILQDRTPEDIQLVGSEEYLEGYIFQLFPHLLTHKLARSPRRKRLEKNLRKAGFCNLETSTFWETSRTYSDLEAFVETIKTRLGRPILYNLTDREICNLVDFLTKNMKQNGPIEEKIRWTAWAAWKRVEEK